MKATLLLSTPPLPPFLTSKLPTLASSHPSLHLNLIPRLTFTRRRRFRPHFTVHADDGDGGGIDEYELDEFDAEEFDNRKDYDVDYEEHPLAGGVSDDILMVHGGSNSKSFFESSEEWGSESVVDYRINEDEFHKFSLLHCDFFIRKPPDPDNDVYDFGEMYVTPPDTDVYYIPEHIRCVQSDYGRYDVTEPPIDAPRDPLYKSDYEVLKASVFLTKHYKNRRLGDPEFVLDFEEIYVIDSKTKSITRARVLVEKLSRLLHDMVTVPGGRNRNRKSDLLVVRDNGTSFKIIPASERVDATTVIAREDWEKSRQDLERHLSKLRDFNVSNWF
ncbi:hypothetical protein RHGRI_016844 [Rhododendron griersonianum]|uniref:Plastid transcriptionally active 6 n=1 Tax=Rhododendron griersonianum TaxID=479676 RepID=A0AAV6JVN1_9ERIC|nr:hypothetical protein RHGRI_016844 [Rhododendron griersonianum]